MNVQTITITMEAIKGFYPTPPELADKLLAGIDWDYIETVLEPSAGKGDLVKATAKNAHVSRYNDKRLDVDCVEIDPYLRSILEHEFKETEQVYVVHDDFLTFQSRKHYGLIVMNPPFADGDAHLLKAIELQKRWGGQIRCLLNAETLLNPYTNRRKVLQTELTELGAEVEYIEGGFSQGERATDVTVALIKITIPQVKEDSDIYQRLSKAAHLDEESAQDVTDMAVTDFMEQIVSRFNVEVDAGLELIRQYVNMRPYILSTFDKACHFECTTLTLCVGDPSKTGGQGSIPSVNKYLKLVRGKYWSALFRNKEFVGKLTSNLREKYQSMVDEMVKYDFTLFNIQKIAAQMNAEMGKGVQDTIVELFDKMTEKHTWYSEMEKNIHYYNGWKTNKAHKIGGKVILPIYGVFADRYWSRETFSVYKAEKIISDIENVFDYLDGNMTASVNLHGVLQTACEQGQTRNMPCKFFDVTLYKKGTMHIRFRNQELVDRFNICCCKHKEWLPPSYGKARYSNMQAEEKIVVDSFHGDGKEGSGEKEYSMVMARADYFLSEPVNEVPLLMAGAQIHIVTPSKACYNISIPPTGGPNMSNYEKAVQLWQEKHIQTDAELAEALNGHSIVFAYHSGKIENERVTYLDTLDIFQHDRVTGYTGDLRTLFEIRNAKAAYELFLCAFRDKRPLDEKLILEFQLQLTQNAYDARRWQLGERPGEYKHHDYVTSKGEVGASPEDVSAEIAELLDELQEVQPEKILTAAAYFHAKFESIHPFADGNGRTGRLAMNYLLVLHGHPPITIHEKDRKGYFEALEAWDERQELEPLVRFLRWQTEKTWEKQVARAEKLL